jgi:hypothetical protein
MKKKLKQNSAKHIPDIINYKCTVTKISNIFNGLDIYLCKFILLLSFLCVMKAPLSGLHVSGSFLIKKINSDSRLCIVGQFCTGAFPEIKHCGYFQ